ncbi:unnamed protein product, partial [marine sediment metagenome]
MREFTKSDFEGVDVYERTDQGPRIDDEFRWGVYHRDGLGAVPGTEQLLAPLLDVEEKSGLVSVADDKRPMAVQALQLMVFAPDQAAATDPISGQASFVVGSTGSPWVQAYVGQGYMVMVNLASVSTGNPRLMMTKTPKTIVYYAKRGGGYAMVAGPPALAVAASQLATQPEACQAGYVRKKGVCTPMVLNGKGPPQTNGQPAAAAAEAPKWLVPVAIAAGVL